MQGQDTRRNYAVISADTHAGAALLDYKSYLPSEFHDDFDAWAAEFSDGWSEHDVAEVRIREEHDKNLHLGISSFGSPYNWDTEKRLAHLEGDGIVAEVLFPNTVPPFYPTAVITASSPTTAEEYRYRWAGVKAHNRWLVDFCAAVPGRRAGIAQVFLNDLSDTIEEVRWAREHGLAGVLVPGDHHRKLVNLYELSLDPFWAACAELDMPVHRHSQAVSEPETALTGPAAPAIGIKEGFMFLSRTLPHLMIGGVFHRHPTLKFVFTEATAAWAVEALANLDAYYKEATTKGSKMYTFGNRAVGNQQLLPSEYARRNLYFGGVMTHNDIAAREALGVDRLMWGADYPHHEGTYPYTTLALRNTLSGISEEDVRAIVSTNAASVYGFNLDDLQPIADKIGPSVADLATPLEPADIPAGNVCFAFAESAGAFH